MVKAQQLLLKTRPSEDNLTMSNELFELKEVELPALQDGQVLVEVQVFSCDPTQRIWMTDVKQYMPPVALGDPMRSGFVGKVIESKSAKLAIGDNVAGLGHWATHLIVSDSSVGKLPAGLPPATAIACGMTLETAYIGLVHIGRVRPGDVVFVSGAAGATGAGVVQIAKIMGCTVIGCAGGAEKCKRVVEELGADACIDYKSEDVGARLHELTKENDGINVYFDNVGGSILEAALDNLAMNARVAMCGAISQYNSKPEDITGPRNYTMLLMRRATMEGFIVSDDPKRTAEARQRIQRWLAGGQIKVKVDAVEAPFSDAAVVCNRLFTSQNNGKLVHVIKQ